jgi:hypothetical protein
MAKTKEQTEFDKLKKGKLTPESIKSICDIYHKRTGRKGNVWYPQRITTATRKVIKEMIKHVDKTFKK